MTPNAIITTLLFAVAIGTGTKASANDSNDLATAPSKPLSGAPSGTVAAARAASSTKTCRADEDTLRVLKLTTFDGGVRVDYEFVVSGRATWTNMNRPLLRQFGIRAAGTFCLPKDTRLADESDYD
ncbi:MULTISPECIES: hypothetical protein [unclassified Variovorax]|jgi:hypothetical protein|uniref:hypothetical protein n=1 Tax=unclassified Variovorax TaxID=663243 RepID=UPI002B2330C0|nr:MULTISPECIES: hypothetical protein [unclassified Variovorax]MEB0060080.1 hypothetical protein [Variovorax sp. LG9.2]MEB0114020.1 hypothetical protein [Variovorax sp. RTB1]